MNKIKNIVIIPARGGSKRLPKKNILPLNGKPLIAHSIDYAKANGNLIDDIYVTTDSDTIKEVALHYGAKVIDRPASISGDLEPTVTALKHVLKETGNFNVNIVLLQVTNPLRPKALLSEAIKCYVDLNLKSLFSVSLNDKKLGKIENDSFKPYNYTFGQRSQDMEKLYYENGLIYITHSSLILKEQIMNEESYPFYVESSLGEIDIDTQDDFDYAQFMIKKYGNEL